MHEESSEWPVKRMRMTTGRRIGNALMDRLVPLNIVPGTVMLTAVGRRSGEPRRTPVTPVVRDGQLYLVAPYGPVGWVRNARAAGTVRLTGKVAGTKTDAEYAVREVPAEEAGPVLKEYLAMASAVRSYFAADKDAPVTAFVEEAHTHPVFVLTPVSAG